MLKTEKKLIGIFGGSFDPPHDGHIKIAKYCIKKLNLDILYWVVAVKNPFKKKSLFSIKKRLKKSQILVNKFKKIKVINLERFLNSSRSINVVKYFKKNNKKNSKIFFIIGSDNLLNFHKWKSAKQLTKLCKIVVFPRKGYDQKAKNSVIMRHLNRSNILFIRSKKINISSSNIRKRYLNK